MIQVRLETCDYDFLVVEEEDVYLSMFYGCIGREMDVSENQCAQTYENETSLPSHGGRCLHWQ